MKQILVYSDSLSWGIIPNTRKRLSFEKRWPGVLERALNNQGKDVRIIENCLNGRRSVWSDPYKDGRDGSIGLGQVIEINSPLDLVILMLGNNDFQCTHNNNAWMSAQGIAKLVNIIRRSPVEPGMPIPSILIVVPPPIIEPKGAIASKFQGAEKRCKGFSEELQIVAREQSTYYFDSGRVITASVVDGIHLDEDQHQRLGAALASELCSYV